MALLPCVFCRKFKWSISAFFLNLADVSLAAGPAKCYLALEITFHLEKQHKVSLGNDSRHPYLPVCPKRVKSQISLSCPALNGVVVWHLRCCVYVAILALTHQC